MLPVGTFLMVYWLGVGRVGSVCGSPARRKAELKFVESKLKLYMPPTRQLVKSFYKIYFLHVVLLFRAVVINT